MNFICFPLEEEMRKDMRQEVQRRRILLISAINLSLGGCKQKRAIQCLVIKKTFLLVLLNKIHFKFISKPLVAPTLLPLSPNTS